MAKKKEPDDSKIFLRMSYVAIVCAIGFAALSVFPGVILPGNGTSVTGASVSIQIMSGVMVYVSLGVFVAAWQESRSSKTFEEENSVRLGKNLT